ncbi:MAG: hypothetical protein FWG42_08315, partial [Clostridiales bacterium]|nr:hypothetical protein [Clostridiales bacterium]
DNRNNMVKAVCGESTVLAKYNGDGLRVEKTIDGNACMYLYEYDKMVLERTAAAPRRLLRRLRRHYGTNRKRQQPVQIQRV